MDKHEKFNLVCEQFGSLQNLNPPMRIDWMTKVGWHLLFERDDLYGVSLVYLHVENGIGIADMNRKGYTPTPCYIYDGVNGQQAVDWFNENILDLLPVESRKIVASTF